jgi:hypothetical protein
VTLTQEPEWAGDICREFLTSTFQPFFRGSLLVETYLPEDSGCQRLVGQEKTYHLRPRERGKAEEGKETSHAFAKKKCAATDQCEPNLYKLMWFDVYI